MCSSADGALFALETDALRVNWSERVAADAGLAEGPLALFSRESATFDALVDGVVARSAPAGEDADDSRLAPSALALGRAVFAAGLDLPTLQRLLGHLHDAVVAWTFREAAEGSGGTLCPGRAETLVGEVRRALERPVLEATRGWFDAAASKLRHDVKTPLQATSLNLELLTLESAERGLDTEALDTIQRSLDQVVALLARAEPVDG